MYWFFICHSIQDTLSSPLRSPTSSSLTELMLCTGHESSRGGGSSSGLSERWQLVLYSIISFLGLVFVMTMMTGEEGPFCACLADGDVRSYLDSHGALRSDAMTERKCILLAQMPAGWKIEITSARLISFLQSCVPQQVDPIDQFRKLHRIRDIDTQHGCL